MEWCLEKSWWRLLKPKCLTLALHQNKFNNLDYSVFFNFLHTNAFKTLSHIYIYIYIYIHTHTSTYKQKYIDIHIYIQNLTHTHTHTDAHKKKEKKNHIIYIYIYIYIYMCVCVWYRMETQTWLSCHKFISAENITSDADWIIIIYIYIYIYIYIVIHRQTVSFYQNSSVWLDPQDTHTHTHTHTHPYIWCTCIHTLISCL